MHTAKTPVRAFTFLVGQLYCLLTKLNKLSKVLGSISKIKFKIACATAVLKKKKKY